MGGRDPVSGTACTWAAAELRGSPRSHRKPGMQLHRRSNVRSDSARQGLLQNKGVRIRLSLVGGRAGQLADRSIRSLPLEWGRGLMCMKCLLCVRHCARPLSCLSLCIPVTVTFLSSHTQLFYHLPLFLFLLFALCTDVSRMPF